MYDATRTLNLDNISQMIDVLHCHMDHNTKVDSISTGSMILIAATLVKFKKAAKINFEPECIVVLDKKEATYNSSIPLGF
jgi:putative intracellular protease/amidase